MGQVLHGSAKTTHAIRAAIQRSQASMPGTARRSRPNCGWNHARNGHHECSYIAQVRIRVRAGDNVICREGSGSGHGVSPTPGEAHEHALKQAETDAMKRALVTSAIPSDWRSMTRSRMGQAPRRQKEQIDRGPGPWDRDSHPAIW